MYLQLYPNERLQERSAHLSGNEWPLVCMQPSWVLDRPLSFPWQCQSYYLAIPHFDSIFVCSGELSCKDATLTYVTWDETWDWLLPLSATHPTALRPSVPRVVLCFILSWVECACAVLCCLDEKAPILRPWNRKTVFLLSTIIFHSGVRRTNLDSVISSAVTKVTLLLYTFRHRIWV